MNIEELIVLENQNYGNVLDVYEDADIDTMAWVSFCFHCAFYDNRINFLLSLL